MGRHATEVRSRRAFPLLLVGLLLLAAGCFTPPPPPPPSAPQFPGYPSIPHYSGTQCKSVLLIGDSLMTPVNNVQDVLQQSGRWRGSSTSTGCSIDWPRRSTAA